MNSSCAFLLVAYQALPETDSKSDNLPTILALSQQNKWSGGSTKKSVRSIHTWFPLDDPISIYSIMMKDPLEYADNGPTYISWHGFCQSQLLPPQNTLRTALPNIVVGIVIKTFTYVLSGLLSMVWEHELCLSRAWHSTRQLQLQTLLAQCPCINKLSQFTSTTKLNFHLQIKFRSSIVENLPRATNVDATESVNTSFATCGLTSEFTSWF